MLRIEANILKILKGLLQIEANILKILRLWICARVQNKSLFVFHHPFINYIKYTSLIYQERLLLQCPELFFLPICCEPIFEILFFF